MAAGFPETGSVDDDGDDDGNDDEGALGLRSAAMKRNVFQSLRHDELRDESGTLESDLPHAMVTKRTCPDAHVRDHSCWSRYCRF